MDQQRGSFPLVFSALLNEQVRRGAGAELERLLDTMSRLAPDISRTAAVQHLRVFAWPPVPAESVVLPWPDLPDAFRVPDRLRVGRRWWGLRRRFIDITVCDPLTCVPLMLKRSAHKTAMAREWGPTSEASAERFRRALRSGSRHVDEQQVVQLMEETILAVCPPDDHGQYSVAEREARIARVFRKFGIEE